MGWTGLVDLEGLQNLSQGPSLRYASPCDCLDLQLGATWSNDREWPIIAIQVDAL